jgi:hypothetical protein
MDNKILFQEGTSLTFLNRVQDTLNQDLYTLFNTLYSVFLYINKPLVVIEEDKGRVFVSSGSIYIYLDKGYFINFPSSYIPIRSNNFIIGLSIRTIEEPSGDPQLEDIPLSSVLGSSKLVIESTVSSFQSSNDVIPIAFIEDNKVVYIPNRYSNIQSTIYEYWSSIFGLYISKGFYYSIIDNKIKISPGLAYINQLVIVRVPTILELKPGNIMLNSLGDIYYEEPVTIPLSDISYIYSDLDEVIDNDYNSLIEVDVSSFSYISEPLSIPLFNIDTNLNIIPTSNRVIDIKTLKENININTQLISKYLNLLSITRQISIKKSNLIVESSIKDTNSDPFHPESKFEISNNQAIPTIDYESFSLTSFVSINTFRSNGWIIPLHSKDDSISKPKQEELILPPLSRFLLVYIRGLDINLGLYQLEIVSTHSIQLDRTLVQSLNIGLYTSINTYSPDERGRLSITIKTQLAYIKINSYILELDTEHHLLEKQGEVILKQIQGIVSSTEDYCWITNNKDTLVPLSINLIGFLSKVIDSNSSLFIVKYTLFNQIAIDKFTSISDNYYIHGSRLTLYANKGINIDYSTVRLPISNTKLYIDINREYEVNYTNWNINKEGSLIYRYLIDGKEVLSIDNKRRFRAEIEIKPFAIVKENSTFNIGQTNGIGIYISRTYSVEIYKQVEVILEGLVSNAYISSNEGQTWDEMLTIDNKTFSIDNLPPLVNIERGDGTIEVLERNTIKLKIEMTNLKGFSIYLY